MGEPFLGCIIAIRNVEDLQRVGDWSLKISLLLAQKSTFALLLVERSAKAEISSCSISQNYVWIYLGFDSLLDLKRNKRGLDQVAAIYESDWILKDNASEISKFVPFIRNASSHWNSKVEHWGACLYPKKLFYAFAIRYSSYEA